MILHKKEKEFKYAKSLVEESNEIRKQIQEIKLIKLDKPIHNGYVRYFTYSAEAIRRPDFFKLKEAFDFCGQNKAFSKTISFLNKKKQEIKPRIKKVDDPIFNKFISYEKLERQLEFIKKHSKYLVYSKDIYSCNCNRIANEHFIPHYEFARKDLLDVVTNDWYLTHYRPVDGELEGRLKKINNEMYKKNYWSLLYGNSREKDDYSWTDLKSDAHKFYYSLEHEI